MTSSIVLESAAEIVTWGKGRNRTGRTLYSRADTLFSTAARAVGHRQMNYSTDSQVPQSSARPK